jgi:hypothetical protein
MYKMNYIKKRTPSCHPIPTILPKRQRPILQSCHPVSAIPKRQRKKIRAILQSFLIRVPAIPQASAKKNPCNPSILSNPRSCYSPSDSEKKSVQSFNPL